MPKRKRGNAEGSIYKMKDGRWRAAVTDGWKLNAAGKKIPKRKVITGATRHGVSEELKKSLRDQQRGINITPEKQTIAVFLKDWLKAVKSNVAPATYVSYEGTVRLYLVPHLGNVILAKLSAHNIQRFKDEITGAIVKKGPGVKKAVEANPTPASRHLSPASVRYCLVVLRMALDHACKLDLVPRNVALLVDYPQGGKRRYRPFTPEQARRFIEAARESDWRAVLRCPGHRASKGRSAGAPMVRHRLRARYTRCTIHATADQDAGRRKGSLILKEPKRSSRRTINLPQVCLSALHTTPSQQESGAQFAGTQMEGCGLCVHDWNRHAVGAPKPGTRLPPNPRRAGLAITSESTTSATRPPRCCSPRAFTRAS